MTDRLKIGDKVSIIGNEDLNLIILNSTTGTIVGVREDGYIIEMNNKSRTQLFLGDKEIELINKEYE